MPARLEQRNDQRYRRRPIDVHGDQAGCLVLVQPFFFEEGDWIAPPADWAPNFVQGKGYDTDIGEGRLLWQRVQAALAAPSVHAIAEDRYGKPMLVQPRLGQGAFRVVVTKAIGLRARGCGR